MATRNVTTATPAPPFEAPPIPPMSLDEAISAVNHVCQAWVGMQSLASVLVNIKLLETTGASLRIEIQGLTEKRQAAQDALAVTELEVEEATAKATGSGKQRQEKALADAVDAEQRAKSRIDYAYREAERLEKSAASRAKEHENRVNAEVGVLLDGKRELESQVRDLESQRSSVASQVANLKSELSALKERLG